MEDEDSGFTPTGAAFLLPLAVLLVVACGAVAIALARYVTGAQ